MTPPTTAHRPDFSVRCACGVEYHTSDAHVGRVLPCKCGRSVRVARPPEAPRAETRRVIEPEKKVHSKVRRRRRSSQAESRYTGDSRLGYVSHRVSVFLASTLRPLFFGTQLERVTAMLAWGYLVGMLVAWGALIYSSEQSLPGTVIAYGPRWLALYPLVLLVPLSFIVARPTLVPLAIASWLCVGPIMGVRVAFSTLFASGFPVQPTPDTFRLLTYNVDGGERLAIDLAVMLRDEAPDIVTFQECSDHLWQSLESIKDWHTARHGSLCTGSRWPISQVDLMPRADFARISSQGFGGTALVMRTFISTPHGPLVLVNLHLETARKGLEGMLGSEGFVSDDTISPEGFTSQKTDFGGPTNSERFARNSDIRRAESQRASHWVTGQSKTTPLVIAGDFNLPVESTIFHDFWRQFNDAFETTGNGLGWTKREGRWLRIRIDHVLTTDAGPKPLRIKIGNDYSSDHLPVVVDLAWPTTNGSAH